MECNRLGLCRCSAIADARLWGLRGVRGGGGGHAEGFRRGTSGLHAAGIRAQGARHLRHDVELLPLLPREWPRMTPHGGGQLCSCFDVSFVPSFFFLLLLPFFTFLRSHKLLLKKSHKKMLTRANPVAMDIDICERKKKTLKHDEKL